MKKILALMLAGIMVVGLFAGCGGAPADETQTPGTEADAATTEP